MARRNDYGVTWEEGGEDREGNGSAPLPPGYGPPPLTPPGRAPQDAPPLRPGPPPGTLYSGTASEARPVDPGQAPPSGYGPPPEGGRRTFRPIPRDANGVPLAEPPNGQAPAPRNAPQDGPEIWAPPPPPPGYAAPPRSAPRPVPGPPPGSGFAGVGGLARGLAPGSRPVAEPRPSIRPTDAPKVAPQVKTVNVFAALVDLRFNRQVAPLVIKWLYVGCGCMTGCLTMFFFLFAWSVATWNNFYFWGYCGMIGVPIMGILGLLVVRVACEWALAQFRS